MEYIKRQPNRVCAYVVICHVFLFNLCYTVIVLLYYLNVALCLFVVVSVQVKELIRRAKRWQKEQWTSSGDDGKPKSYLIGILMSEACRRWCVEKGWDVDELHNHMSPTTFDEYVLG